MRGVFNVPMSGAEELARYFLICLSFVGAGYVTAEGGQIRMEEFQVLIPPTPRWLLQLAIELAAWLCSPCSSSRASSRSCNNLRNQTPTLEMPFWLFMAPLALGSLLLVVETIAMFVHTWRRGRPEDEADSADLRGPRWKDSSSSSRFVFLFVLGFPVVLAIGIPCVVYMLLNGLPLDLIAQRTLYALDSFPLVAVPVFLFVGSLMNSAGISRYIYKFADTAVGRLARRARAGEHLRQPDLRRHVGLGAGRHRRPRPHRDRRDARQGLQARLRRRGDALVGDRRADLPAQSIPLIIYGTVTGVSVIQLLLGGILPGLLCVAMLMLMTGWLAVRRNYPRAARWPTVGELWRDFKPALPAIVAPVILIAGMLAGVLHADRDRVGDGAYAMLISACSIAS